MDKEQALQSFWSQFGIPAYDEGTVPDNAALPYITYSVGVDDFQYSVSLTASIWYRSTSWSGITAKLNEVSNVITSGGCMIPYDGGAIWLRKGSPYAQRVSDEDNSIRRILLNYEAEYIQ